MLREFPAIRQVFHALCAMSEGEDATAMLEFALRQPWMADLARRARSVARIDATTPFEAGNEDLLETLFQLYAASRVRDVLLLAHQPGPAGDSVFASIGCQPVTEPTFDPILHEIITCEAAADPGAPIQVTGHAWPALMIGELVFARAGVHVRAGSAHAVPGVADRSTLHWEYWRRHRVTSDGSFWWGHNSQWGTEFRRDYLTSRGRVYDFDAFSRLSSRRRIALTGQSTPPLVTADQASFIKNRCQLRTDGEPGFRYLDYGTDERQQ